MIIIGIFIVLLGLAFGSFTNVLVYRIPRDESFIIGRSRCTHCGTAIRFYDNIPLLSYLLLKGRCRHCGHRISAGYPLIELYCGIQAGWVFAVYGLSLNMVFMQFLLWVLFVIAIIDMKTMLVPMMLVWWLAIVGIVRVAVEYGAWQDYLLGAGIAAIVFLGSALLGKILFGKDAMGSGDIWLVPVIGLYLGWRLTLLMLFLTFLTAAVVSLGLMIIGKTRMGREIPFIPYITAATFITALAGDEIIAWYIRHFWT